MLKQKLYLIMFLMLVYCSLSNVHGALISHYTFDTDCNDSGTIPRNGTIVGSASIASGGPQGSGYLSLTGGHVDLPAYGGPGWLTSGVTITAWVKADNPLVGGDIFSQAWYSPSNGTIQMRQTAVGVQAVSLTATQTSTIPAAAGEWYHVVWVGRASTGMHELWINGIKYAETLLAWQVYPNNLFKAMDGAATIGSWGDINIFIGGVDDLRIYDTALSPGEIQELQISRYPMDFSSASSAIDYLGVNMHLSDPTDQNKGWYQMQMDQAVAMGLKVVRISNDWAWDLPDDVRDPDYPEDWTYNFDGQEWLVDQLQIRGLRPLIIVNFSHPVYESNSNSITTPAGVQAFADFCSSMMSQFKNRGIIWEMWNEANAEGSWNVNQYMTAMKAGMDAMRAVDPNCIIIAPSTNHFDTAFLTSCFNLDLLNYVTGVSIHPYHSRSDGPEVNISLYSQLRTLIDGYNSLTPIVNSELGYTQLVAPGTIITQDEQAALVIRSILIDQMCGIPLHIVYNNRDYDGNFTWDQASFGVVTWDGQPKSSYYALQELTELLDGLKYEQRLDTSLDDDYALVFGDKSKKIIVLWTSVSPHSAEITLPVAPVAMWDMKGNSLPLPQSSEYQLSSQPVYLKYALSADITSDGVVDINDIAVVAQDWLSGDYTTTGVAPDDATHLLSRYTFDTGCNDSGTIPRNGAIVGSASITSGGPQGSGYLSLTGGHVDLPAYGGPGWLTSGVTITAWVKADNPLVGGDIFSQAWYSPSNGTIQMRQTANGTQVTSLVTTSTAGVPAAAGEWYHIAWVGRAISGMQEIWINGVKTGETWMPWSPWPANVFKAMDGAATIGSWGTDNVLMGGIDDLRIYDEALDATGIATTIPEPATMFLLGIGALLFGKKR